MAPYLSRTGRPCHLAAAATHTPVTLNLRHHMGMYFLRGCVAKKAAVPQAQPAGREGSKQERLNGYKRVQKLGFQDLTKAGRTNRCSPT